jgi:hypothetical protein
MIAAGHEPTDAQIDMLRQVKGTGSEKWVEKVFAAHDRGSRLLGTYLQQVGSRLVCWWPCQTANINVAII